MSVLHHRTAQLVACAFELTTDSDDIAARMDDLVPSAEQAHPILERHAFTVRRDYDSDAFLVSEDTRSPTRVSTSDEAIALLARRMHEIAMHALADRTKLHAGCASWDGWRFLLVGGQGAGKTTLITRLLKEDCQVEGDELVLFSDGEAVAYPRRFGVRRLTLSLVPELGALAPHLATGPGAMEPGGYHVIALDPGQLRISWRIGRGPVNAVFFLGPRAAGASEIDECSTATALESLLYQSVAPASGTSAWIRDLSMLISHAKLYHLRVGDLDSGVGCVRKMRADEQRGEY